jgi:hypothetical protein
MHSTTSVMEQRHLAQAIHRAERYYQQTAGLGGEFNRHLDRIEADLRQAGYLERGKSGSARR